MKKLNNIITKIRSFVGRFLYTIHYKETGVAFVHLSISDLKTEENIQGLRRCRHDVRKKIYHEVIATVELKLPWMKHKNFTKQGIQFLGYDSIENILQCYRTAKDRKEITTEYSFRDTSGMKTVIKKYRLQFNTGKNSIRELTEEAIFDTESA